MKNLITKFALLAILAVSISSCEKSPLEEVEVSGAGLTTIELAKGAALSATGTTGASVVTLNYIAGEKLFPSKVIPKLTVYYLANTPTAQTAVRTVLYTATNVSLVATPAPVAGAPVVTAIGPYGNANNIVWGLTYTFNLSQLGLGLYSTTNGNTSSTKGTSIIIVAQDAANVILAEYTTVISEFGLKTI